ncbi:alpha/beta hydrolase [Volucribacter amazonae]|uniref:Transcriptional regulator n=1 Tax=Volucribacter amazonae TaxID=256731 RepID=A0A9X4SIF4_9PAST|nr:alpha/beta hydrolase [Volucribacter amazonae]MDG6895575.1 transcriptional regulator [Volucribacter amazonae]
MKLKKLLLSLLMAGSLISPFSYAQEQNMSYPTGYQNFYQSQQVQIEKVRFANPYGIEIVGNLVLPKGFERTQGKLPAIVIGHPLGAVKEQASMLYAQVLAEQGFATLAIDLPFWGESGGQPRQAVEPTLYADAFSSAVDYLQSLAFIQSDRIAVLGICASGGYVLDASKIDPRIKAVATVAMVDMGTVMRGLLAANPSVLADSSEQRRQEYQGASPVYTGGTVTELKPDTDAMQREFYDFYRTARGEFTPAGADKNHTTMPTLSSNVKFANFYPLNDLDRLARPVLFITGDEAQSKIFSEMAYQNAGEPKELYYVQGANHTDMYDNADKIPFAKLVDFYRVNLK